MDEKLVKAKLAEKGLPEGFYPFLSKIETDDEIISAIDNLTGLLPRPKTLADVLRDPELKRAYELELQKEGDRRVSQAKPKIEQKAAHPEDDELTQKIRTVFGPQLDELKNMISEQQRIVTGVNRKNQALELLRKEGLSEKLVEIVNLDKEDVGAEVTKLKNLLATTVQESNNQMLADGLIIPRKGAAGETNIGEAAVIAAAEARNNQATGGGFNIPKSLSPRT